MDHAVFTSTDGAIHAVTQTNTARYAAKQRAAIRENVGRFGEMMTVDHLDRVVCWLSGGVPSAVAAKITATKYAGKLPVLLVNTDTRAEDDDNYRFMRDIADWCDVPLMIIASDDYVNPHDVYEKTGFLVSPYGARCSTELKKKVREKFQRLGSDLQIFGFTADESGRAERFTENNPLIDTEFPLVDLGIDARQCHEIILRAGIKRPRTYDLGFKNANCLKSGCVKGGMGYWNWFRGYNPSAFDRMARIERELDVAICHSEDSDGNRVRIFLDELEVGRGNYQNEPAIQCSIFCREVDV